MEQEIIYTRQPYTEYIGGYPPFIYRFDRRDADRTKLMRNGKYSFSFTKPRPCNLYNAGTYCAYCNGPEYCSNLEAYTSSIWGTPAQERT